MSYPQYRDGQQPIVALKRGDEKGAAMLWSSQRIGMAPGTFLEAGDTQAEGK
jgi:hypothetical protein